MNNTNSDLQLLKACRGCSGNLTEFLHYEAVPIAGTYLTKMELGKEPLLPLTVTFCNDCGLVQLKEIIPSNIYTSYRFMGTGSTNYRAYLERVTDSLTTEWHLRNKRILEIGCSDGYLLKQLRDSGCNQVYGYEPSSQLWEICKENDIPASRTFFSLDSLEECKILPAHAIIIRHVLEHIDNVHEFLTAVSTALVKNGLLILEVPDVKSILSKSLYFHFYHEHLSYFSLLTLQRLLFEHGFRIIFNKLTAVHGGSLYVICRRQNGNPISWKKKNNNLEKICRIFAILMQSYLNDLHHFVQMQCADKVSFAGYGAAQRTVVACSLAALTRDHIEYLVDKNSYLHGLYIPGAHLPIYALDRLYTDPKDAVIIFATSFEEEITKEQKIFKKRGGRLVSLFPKPRYLS